MDIEYDPNKNEKNIRERGLSFEKVHEFDFDTAIYYMDDRKDYGEKRIIAIGKIHERVHVLVFKSIDNGIRVISFRKANKREVTRYEQETQS
ncbi:BrnT family toxin [Oxalobacter aliiformigenes]|uniref:BrnT family toxin n=1 Tax=Oxalobacter aliiformigenes TaxID=2946593 RepID=UPI0022AF081B|nr:BrnT family toxin [Oxalobacter aliiformigenes]MCZ4065702.1 BrnT family toxin [Oxalobacter aliiformigenes]WAV98666.1 BrnT family toxin [Oxalobacter aliiformigenes]